MLSVNSVNAYNPKYEVKPDNESKNLSMKRATRYRQPGDEIADYEKQKRKAKIKSGIITTATVLGSLGFVVLVALQLLSMRPRGGVLDVVTNEEVAKHLGFDEMVQQPEIKKFWQEQLAKIKHEKFFSEHHIGKGGIAMLFYGPPGTGKTEGAYALKKYFGDKALLARIDCTSFKDSLHGSSEKKIVRSLKEAKQLCQQNPNKKVIVLLDEMSIANKDESINSELTKSMQDAFKAHFLDLAAEPNVIIIGTTNHASKDIPISTLLDSAIMDRFSELKYYPTPSEDQFLSIFKSRITEWEKTGVVEPGFFTKNETQLRRLAKEMEDGKASFRAYWLGVEERIKGVAAARYEKTGLTGDGRNIIIEDITEAVETCKKEGNWGVKAEEKGINEDVIHSILSFFGKNGDAVPEA